VTWLLSAGEVLAAYILIDALTGLYHLATDCGLNSKRVVDLFKDHHDTNTMEGFDEFPMRFGLPVMLAGLLLGSSFLLALGSFTVLAQVPHYYAHRRSRSPLVHRVVRLLQRGGLMISPQHHAAHHDGRFSRNFCIVSGWNNWWMNWLIALAEVPRAWRAT
jgi:hypothetical protein